MTVLTANSILTRNQEIDILECMFTYWMLEGTVNVQLAWLTKYTAEAH